MGEIKKDVMQVIYIAFAITSILIVVAILFFGCSGNSEPIKSAFSLMGNYVGGITTLAAAYIASLLFNNWREQHNKQVDSDFIMKLYDCLFEMRTYSINTVGFMRDYLSKVDKHKFKEELINNSQYLCRLIDFSALKLSDVAYVITEKDYEEKFSPQISIIIDELYLLNDLYRSCINSDNSNEITIEYKGTQNLKSIDEKLGATLTDLNERYKSFMIELKIYYKA